MRAVKILAGSFAILLIIIGSITFSNYEAILKLKENVNNDLDTGNIQEINVALWDYEIVGYDKKLIEEFIKDNPNIKVNVIDIPNDKYDNNLTMMLSSGEDIDVFYARTTYEYGKMIQNDFARSLEDLIVRDKIETKVYEDALRVNSNIYGIPYRSDFKVLYYNKDIFNKNKVPYPTDNTTWMEYRELAKKTTSTNEKDKVYGFFIEPKFMYGIILSMVSAEDFDILESDLNILREGIELIMSIQYIDESSIDYSTNKALNANQLVFIQGCSAIYINGTWFLNYLINAKQAQGFNFEWGVVSQPNNAGKRDSKIIYTPVCINKKSKNVEASWEFVKFITGKKGAKVLAKEAILPAYIDKDILSIFQEHQDFPMKVLDMLQNYRVEPYLDTKGLGDQVQKMIFEEVELIITNNKTIDTGIADMIKKRQEILQNIEVK